MPKLMRGVIPPFCMTALCLVFALAASTGAQQLPQFDPVVEVIPYRALSEISREIDVASSAKDLARDHQREAEERLTLLDPNIKTRKAQLNEIAAKRELAKRQKRPSEVIALDAEIRAGKSAIDMLGRLKDLRKSELDVSQLRARTAEHTVQTLQLEIELNKRRAERDSLASSGAGDVAVATTTQVIYNLESKLLEAQKNLAELNQEVSGKEREIVSRRMRLYQAHAKLASPKS